MHHRPAAHRAEVTARRWGKSAIVMRWAESGDLVLANEVQGAEQEKAADRPQRREQLNQGTEGLRETGHKVFLKGRYRFVIDRPIVEAL